jgi:hypothetical protein
MRTGIPLMKLDTSKLVYFVYFYSNFSSGKIQEMVKEHLTSKRKLLE